MDVTLRIPDDLADLYKTHGVPLEAALVAQLVRFAAVFPQDRAVVLARADRDALEARLGQGHLRSSADLRAKVERLARLEIGGIEIGWTPAQWEELTHRAKKRGISIEQECRSIVAQMRDLFFAYA
jgi:hypothetical protein